MPDLSAVEFAVAVAAWSSLALATGHIIGAWPGDVIRERNARTKERDAALTEVGALQRQLWDTEEQLDAERLARKTAERQYLDVLDHINNFDQ